MLRPAPRPSRARRPTKGPGFTLLGAPRVTAQLTVVGNPPSSAQVAARLWDVAPGGAGQRLVARGLYRPSGTAPDSFELHANGWHFAAGHVAKLELLGADAPYGRPSNGAFTIDVRALQLRLPVRGAAPLRLRLATRCTHAGLSASVRAAGLRLLRVRFYVGGRAAGVDRRAPFERVVLRRRPRPGRVRVGARVRGDDGRTASTSALAAVCVRRRGIVRFTG